MRRREQADRDRMLSGAGAVRNARAILPQALHRCDLLGGLDEPHTQLGTSLPHLHRRSTGGVKTIKPLPVFRLGRILHGERSHAQLLIRCKREIIRQIRRQRFRRIHHAVLHIGFQTVGQRERADREQTVADLQHIQPFQLIHGDDDGCAPSRSRRALCTRCNPQRRRAFRARQSRGAVNTAVSVRHTAQSRGPARF